MINKLITKREAGLPSILAACLCFILAFYPLSPGQLLAAPKVPAYEESYGYAADLADVLSEDTRGHINAINSQLSSACGAEIMVVTVDFLDGAEIEDYTYTLFNDWGVGSAERNNGILLLLAIGEDNYYAMQGKGLEESFDSGLLGEYLYNYLEEDFASGDYDAGVLKVFDAMVEKVADIYGVGGDSGGEAGGITSPEPGSFPDYYYDDGRYPENSAESKGPGAGFIIMVFLVILLVLMAIIFAAILRDINKRNPRPPIGGQGARGGRPVVYRPIIVGGWRTRRRRPRGLRPPRPSRHPGPRPPAGSPPGSSGPFVPPGGFGRPWPGRRPGGRSVGPGPGGFGGANNGGGRPGGGSSRGGGAGRNGGGRSGGFGGFGGGSGGFGGFGGGFGGRMGGGGSSRGGGAGRR